MMDECLNSGKLITPTMGGAVYASFADPQSETLTEFGQKKVSRVKQFVAVLAVALAANTLAGSAVRAQSFENGNSAIHITYHLGCKEGNCLVPPWSVDTSSVPEFLHLSMTLDAKNQPLSSRERSSYRRALSKYPTPTTCLTKAATTNEGINLLEIDWKALRSIAEAEVCISRIHAAISNPDTSRIWFIELGFSARLETYSDSHLNFGQSVIFADWKGEGRSPFSSIAFFFEEALAVTNLGASVKLSSQNVPLHVQLGYTRK